MKNIESLTTKPVSVLAILDEPYKVLDNKDTYIKSADPEKGKVLICKVIDIDRVERKSGTAVNYLDVEDVEASGFAVNSKPISMRWFRLTSTPPA